MGGSESKPTTSNSKTEVNTSLIQLHWESFGWGMGSLILVILFLSILIIIYYSFKMWCCQRAPRAGANIGYTNWTPMVPMGNLGQIPWVPNTSPVRNTPGPVETAATSSPPPNQLMISDALQRLHDESRNRLNLPF